MLTATKLAKSYNGQPVFTDIDLKIHPGSITFLLGPSGCGKSTLLRLLAFVEEADTGQIQLNNSQYQFPAKQQTPAPHPEVTAVFQQLFLWPHLTLRENILLPIRKRQTAEEQEATVGQLIEVLDMAEFIDRYPNQTSGGQKQRAAIARAVALKPRYLLLDEPSAALDPNQIQNFSMMLRLLLQEKIIFILSKE